MVPLRAVVRHRDSAPRVSKLAAASIVSIAILATACAAPSLESPLIVEIVTHCGLGYSTIEYDGQQWHIEDFGGNPPLEWGNPHDTITVGRLNGEVVALGPDGSLRVLASGPGSGGGCM